MRELYIGQRRIADDEPTYVIAEIGQNHQGNVVVACDLIKAAAQAGASAVKLQKRDVQNLYGPALLNKAYEHENSFGQTYGEHRLAVELDADAYKRCQKAAGNFGVDLFATAFDEASADFLAALNVPAYKVHSGGLTDDRLLAHVASLNRPVILSTGGGTDREIDHAINAVYRVNQRLAVLHCTASYPCDFDQLNLRCITTLRERYPEIVIGWSGHDSGIAMSLVAAQLGASIIEKHFTLNRSMKGTDHAFSLEPGGLRRLCRDLERARVALGDGVKKWYDSEKGPIAKMRRTDGPDGYRIYG